MFLKTVPIFQTGLPNTPSLQLNKTTPYFQEIEKRRRSIRKLGIVFVLVAKRHHLLQRQIISLRASSLCTHTNSDIAKKKVENGEGPNEHGRRGRRGEVLATINRHALFQRLRSLSQGTSESTLSQTLI